MWPDSAPISTGIDPASLAFDVDGVVADTMGLFLDIASSDYRVAGVRYEDISCYQLTDCIDMDSAVIDAIIERLMKGSYRQALKALDGASEVLSRIAAKKSPILFVTARPHPGPLEHWFEEVLKMPGESVDLVATGSSKSKADILLKKGITHFVEDRLDTCFDLQQIGVTPIVFKQPWNRQKHPFLEVASWKELSALLAF